MNTILPFVLQPGRYIGNEINIIKKELKQVQVHIALAFPDMYEIGMSHFGLKILYHIINEQQNWYAERVFTPGLDMVSQLKRSNHALCSLETQTPLHQFNIIGFSLLYELNYTNILTMLDLANIPFYAAERDETYPIIIGGGTCSCNPEPIADFFDAIVFGDGENVIIQLLQVYQNWDKKNKQALFTDWSHIEGVYIPDFFKSTESGLVPKYSNYHTIQKAMISDLNESAFPCAPVIAFGKPIHDRLNLEIARGCSRGCRFCQAGIYYRPVRERSIDTLMTYLSKGLKATGYDEVSMLSLSSGDYSQIEALLSQAMNICRSDNIAISLPSLRVDTLTTQLMALIKQVRKTGFTIAPEAGSQRLRDVINKRITENEIKNTVINAFNMGWRLIKLYFMIGLPTETDDDLYAIHHLVKELQQIRTSGNKRKVVLNVSFSTFVPKPHTPFQWAKQISMDESIDKINWLKSNIKNSRVNLKWQAPEVSFLEGIMARGDRKLSRLIVKAYQLGCCMDGWSDQFQFNLWQQAMIHSDINPQDYLSEKPVGTPMPWNHLDCRVSQSFFIQEWQKAIHGEKTLDCRTEGCSQCGVCDFKTYQPVLFNTPKNNELNKIDTSKQDISSSDLSFQKIQVHFSKTGMARFIGHLELVNIFVRAFRRSQIVMHHSGGFHPMPKIVFGNTLPLGMESLDETFFVSILSSIHPKDVIAQLNRHLPEGITILNAIQTDSKSKAPFEKYSQYDITLLNDSFSIDTLHEFINAPSWMITKTSQKGHTRTFDCKPFIHHIDLLSKKCLRVTIQNHEGKTIRPSHLMKQVFKLTDQTITSALVTKSLVSDRSLKGD